MGAAAVTPALAQAQASQAQPSTIVGAPSTVPRNPGYQRGMGGGTTPPIVITPDVQADLERRAKLTQYLPKPDGLRPKAQLDGRFPVYFETSIPEGMRLA